MVGLAAVLPTRNHVATAGRLPDLGREQVTRVGAHPDSTSRTLLKVDLSGLPAKSDIKAARLKVFFTRHVDVWDGTVQKDCALRAFEMKRPWGETGLGHANADYAQWFGKEDKRNVLWQKPLCDGTQDPGDRPVAQTAITTATNAQWLTLDLTALVRNWVSGKTPNHGILLTEQPNGTSLCSFISSESPDVPVRPGLVVVYSEGR